MIEADSPESQRRLLFPTRFRNNYDRPRPVQNGSRPCRILASQSGVNAPGKVSFGIFRRISNVEDLLARIAQIENFL